MIFSIKLSLY